MAITISIQDAPSGETGLEARGMIRVSFVGPNRTQIIKLRRLGRTALTGHK